MGRRTNLASLAAGKVEDVPGHAAPTLVRLRPSQIATTPLNPRRNFGTDEELAGLGESMRVRQLQPVVAVSRAGYLQLWPDHEEQIGAADFVLANGERRYRAARQVDLATLDVVIREEVADSRAAFLDAVLSENLDRKNFDAIEEAQAVEAMVRECGSAKRAAGQFRRHETWVSQRRALLKLDPELQESVRTGELPVRIARSIASVPQAEQRAAWQKAREEETERRTAAKEASSARGQAASKVPDPRSSNSPGDRPGGTPEVAGTEPSAELAMPAGVKTGTSADSEGEVFTAVKTSEPAQPGDGGGESMFPEVESLPWDSLEWLAAMICKRVPAHDIPRLVALLSTDDQHMTA